MHRMSKNEYRAALSILGLSQRSAAKFLDIAERTSRRYALDECPVPILIARFLRLVARNKLTPQDATALTDDPLP